MKKSILLIISSFMLLSVTTYGQSLDSLTKKAESGDSVAQFNLAVMYIKGQNAPPDTAKAFYWYKKSAEQGNINAQFSLAKIYYDGEGTSKDLKKAFYWYKKSTEQEGYPVPGAQCDLAICYYYGQGTSVNKKQAAY